MKKKKNDNINIIKKIIYNESNKLSSNYQLEMKNKNDILDNKNLTKCGTMIQIAESKFTSMFDEYLTNTLEKIRATFEDMNIKMSEAEIIKVEEILKLHGNGLIKWFNNYYTDLLKQVGMNHEIMLVIGSLESKLRNKLDYFKLIESNKKEPRSLIEQIKANRIARISLGITILFGIATLIGAYIFK